MTQPNKREARTAVAYKPVFYDGERSSVDVALPLRIPFGSF